jgi:cystathionine gamma-synthase
VEKIVAGLEEGTFGHAFASGLAAIHAVCTMESAGRHVIIHKDVYSGTRNLLQKLEREGKITLTIADLIQPEELNSLCEEQKGLVWIETPSNPMFDVLDIAEISEIAHKNNYLSIVDNTWLTPIFQKPLTHGADVVIHSGTKFLGGHSDLLSGIAVTNQNEISEQLTEAQILFGATPSAFDCWLLERSLKTLSARMSIHEENAKKIAKWLQNDERVEKVIHPSLFRDEKLTRFLKQSNGYGSMLSLMIKGNEEQTKKVVSNGSIITNATSLGGVESLWEHRKSTEGETSKTPENLIRLSVGIEHVDDLINAIDEALKVI